MPLFTRQRTGLLAWFLAGGAVALLTAATWAWVNRPKHYDQNTPEAVLAAARDMVRTGRADRLPELVYAETPELRRLYEGVGRILGSLQSLAESINRRFPDEVAAYRKQAEEAAASGAASNLISRAIQASRQGRTDQRPNMDPDEFKKLLDNTFREVFADPYAWLTRNESRLTAEYITDDLYGLYWDGKPLTPGNALVIALRDGKWQLDIPAKRFLGDRILKPSPENQQAYEAMLAVLNNTLIDVRRDVESGRADSLNRVAELAGEKAFMPMIFVFIAIDRIQSEEREARRAAEQMQKTPPAQPPSPPSRGG